MTIFVTANSNNVVSLWEIDVYTSENPTTKIEGENLIIDVAEKCIVGIYEFDGTLVKAVMTDSRTVIPYDKSMVYVKIFKWDEISRMIPSEPAMQKAIGE